MIDKIKSFSKFFFVFNKMLILYGCTSIGAYMDIQAEDGFDKSTFENRFNTLMQSIIVDNDFDSDFSAIDLLDCTPYKLVDVVRFSRDHMSQYDYANAAKACAEASSRQAAIDGNQASANAYTDAAKKANIYARYAYKASCAASEICKTQDRFTDAIMKSNNVLNCVKIRKYASRNYDAYCKYFKLRDKVRISSDNYATAAKKAINIHHQNLDSVMQGSTSEQHMITNQNNKDDIIIIEDES